MSEITSLSEYIALLGEVEFSRRYNVKERTAKSWRYGERNPRPAQAMSLIELSDGDLTMAMIYAPSVVVEKPDISGSLHCEKQAA